MRSPPFGAANAGKIAIGSGQGLGRQWYSASDRISRHHHFTGYAALVLSGGYIETGDSGRFHAEAGDILFHDAFEAHQDRFSRRGAEILNLPLVTLPKFACGHCPDPDAIARLAEEDMLAAAAAALTCSAEERFAAAPDWPDLLAQALRADNGLVLDKWADEQGLAPSSVSRGFKLVYGVSPKRYRLEVRAGSAARTLRRGIAPVEAALVTGFADQPHMTRAIRQFFGITPARLRP